MHTLFKKLPPAILAMLVQIIAVALMLSLLGTGSIHFTPLTFALSCGSLAAVFSYLTRQASWWWLIQLLFLPAVVVVLTWEIPPLFFLGAFLIFMLVYWSTFRSQMPLYLSSHKVRQALAELLPVVPHGRSFSFIDLGSGLGGVLTHLARSRPEGRYVGVEAAPLPCFCSWLRIRLAGLSNSSVRWGSMWDCDLGQYDVVFAYLSPVPMARLWHKACAEMRPGSMFISSTFVVLEHPPQHTVQVDDLHRSTLYVWHM